MLTVRVYLWSRLLYRPTTFLCIPHATCKQGKDIWDRFSSFFNYNYFSPVIILLKWNFGVVLDQANFLRPKAVFLAVCNTGCSWIFADAEQQWRPVLPSKGGWKVKWEVFLSVLNTCVCIWQEGPAFVHLRIHLFSPLESWTQLVLIWGVCLFSLLHTPCHPLYAGTEIEPQEWKPWNLF